MNFINLFSLSLSLSLSLLSLKKEIPFRSTGPRDHRREFLIIVAGRPRLLRF